MLNLSLNSIRPLFLIFKKVDWLDSNTSHMTTTLDPSRGSKNRLEC